MNCFFFLFLSKYMYTLLWQNKYTFIVHSPLTLSKKGIYNNLNEYTTKRKLNENFLRLMRGKKQTTYTELKTKKKVYYDHKFCNIISIYDVNSHMFDLRVLCILFYITFSSSSFYDYYDFVFFYNCWCCCFVANFMSLLLLF